MQEVAGEFHAVPCPEFLRKGHRVFAVDGAKVSVQRSDELFDALGCHDNAHCPQMLVSTLYDALAGTIHDVTVAPTHSSERAELRKMLDALAPGDILTLDRGYPSFPIFSELLERGVHFVVRLPTKSTFGPVEDFLAEGGQDGTVSIQPPPGMRHSHESIELRVVVVHGPGGSSRVLATDLDPAEFSSDQLGAIYHLRWQVEELYKLERGNYLGQGQFHAKSLQGLKQEVFALALFINMTRIFRALAAKDVQQPYEHMTQKASVLAVAAYLTRFLLEKDDQKLARLVRQLVTRVSWNITEPRPDRHYPRRSYKPPPKWTPNGRKGERR
jgi:hypothetical protein